MKKTTLFVAGSLAMVFSGCTDSKFEGYTKAESGLYYKFFNRDESGTKVQAGDKLSVFYQISKYSNDSVIMESRQNSRDGSAFSDFMFKKSSFKGSFEDGMMMMAKGDSAAFVISADSFFLRSLNSNELPKTFKPGEFLKGVFAIKSVMPAAEALAEEKKRMAEQEAIVKQKEAEEMPAIEKFVAENKIKVKPRPSGLYYIETKKGSGPAPKETDLVKVHYTGKFLDGKVFDSSIERGQPLEFALNQVIRGWTEGLMLMRKGGKAQMVIPSAIAYGPNGFQSIPPYAPLFFEVELIDFKSTPGNAAAMPGK